MLDGEATLEPRVSALVDAEAALIVRLRREPAAFADVFDLHYDAIASFIYRRTGDVHITEDLTSDVFLNAQRTIHRFRSRGVPLRAWLLRIANNAVNHRLRRLRVRRKAMATLRDRARDRSTSTSAPDDTEYAGLLIRALSVAHQEVLVLHLGCGYGVDQIAQLLRCRPGTVKSRLSRAREALRTLATDMFPEDAP